MLRPSVIAGVKKMVFEGKKLSEISQQDLQKLVDDQVQERDTLEYKRDMYGNSDEDKREMLKDISSIANNKGGHLIIGIAEDGDGIPTEVVGVTPDNHVEQIMASCLSNLDKRIVGLDIKDVQLANNRRAIIISIPHSLNAPHMVTFRGLNQFWKRHGAQKGKMTVDEIGELFDKRLANVNQLDRFLFTRRAKLLEQIGQGTYMVISAIPAFVSNEAIFDVQDKDLRKLIVNLPGQGGTSRDVFCGQPYPTLDGLRADQRTPYYQNPASDLQKYLEIFRNGYIEFVVLLKGSSDDDKYFASIAYTEYIVDFTRFTKAVYTNYIPLTPIVVNISIYNAKDMWLARGRSDNQKLVTWQEQHLDLGKLYVENLAEEAQMLPRKICDRLFQAFHLDDSAAIFDDKGNLKRG